ncbi:MAG TPA: SBBP repeat-containing protein [Bryobacteraceae bacterium]|nr:SBBP repeat-containing protein [Bryobacteraceae bacterium]
MKTILAWTLLLAHTSTHTAAAGNQILLRNLDPDEGSPQVIAADNRGHVFVVAEPTPTSEVQTSRVVELDLLGSRLASMDLPNFFQKAAATDMQGELIVVGSDMSGQGVILKLDPQLQNVLFTKSMPGQIGSVAVDAAGNIYVTGSTSSASFPVTAGAYQTKPPGGDNFGTAVYAFVTEISSGGDQLLYSTYFGSDGAACSGGSHCIGKFGVTFGTTIAVGASGAVYIAGSTTASGLPTTPGALASACNCGYPFSYPVVYSGFLAKLQPGAARQLQWSTYMNGSGLPYGVTVTSITLDSEGNVIVGGNAPSGLPTTLGSYQPSVIQAANAVVRHSC